MSHPWWPTRRVRRPTCGTGRRRQTWISALSSWNLYSARACISTLPGLGGSCRIASGLFGTGRRSNEQGKTVMARISWIQALSARRVGQRALVKKEVSSDGSFGCGVAFTPHDASPRMAGWGLFRCTEISYICIKYISFSAPHSLHVDFFKLKYPG